MGIASRQRIAVRVQELPSHPEVNQENPTTFEPNNQILAATVETRDPLADKLVSDLGRFEGTRQAWIEDLHAVEPAPDEPALELRTNSLDFG
jgi:hypothetical protein